jgi:hypothetical protein
VAVLAAGYRPVIHPSASDAAADAPAGNGH